MFGGTVSVFVFFILSLLGALIDKFLFANLIFSIYLLIVVLINIIVSFRGYYLVEEKKEIKVVGLNLDKGEYFIKEKNGYKKYNLNNENVLFVEQDSKVGIIEEKQIIKKYYLYNWFTKIFLVKLFFEDYFENEYEYEYVVYVPVGSILE